MNLSYLVIYLILSYLHTLLSFILSLKIFAHDLYQDREIYLSTLGHPVHMGHHSREPEDTSVPPHPNPLLARGCPPSSPLPHTPPLPTLPNPLTGGKGVFTQQVHCEFIVGFETIRLANTHQANCGFF